MYGFPSSARQLEGLPEKPKGTRSKATTLTPAGAPGIDAALSAPDIDLESAEVAVRSLCCTSLAPKQSRIPGMISLWTTCIGEKGIGVKILIIKRGQE